MPDDEQVLPPQTPLEGVPVVYVNWLRITASPQDFSMDVGYQVGGLPPQPAVHLVMGWEEAKMLRDRLMIAVESFEEQVGEIRDLDGFVEMRSPKFGPLAGLSSEGEGEEQIEA